MNIVGAAHTARNACIIELWNQKNSMGMIAKEMNISRGVVAGVMYRAWREGTAFRRGIARARAKDGAELPRGGPYKRLPVRMPIQPRRKASEVSMWETRQHAHPIKFDALPRPKMTTPSGREIQWHSANGCRYIENDDVGAPLFCNAVVMAGEHWCPYHYRRVYQRR